MRLVPFLLLLLSALAWSEPLLGVVLEEGTDRAIPYADIQYTSGKTLGQADRRGRFELDVERRNSILLVTRPGFDTLKVELQDYADLKDVVFTLHPNVQALERTTVRAAIAPKWQNDRQVTVAHLEDAAGMRFDVAEHLSQLPGMSGQRDFSSELSYDGSRSEEVAYHLGAVKVPNMRHLDVGFPGNLSVINPRILKGVEVSDQYGSGPSQQGLAAAVQFIPDPGKTEEFNPRVSLGTTLREITMSGPWLFWDSFVLSFRYLDPAMLKNMGEKFFTEFRKRGAPCDNCQIQGNNGFDLSSWDLQARLSGSDTTGAKWSTSMLMSRDDYSIQQDTTSDLGKVNNATLMSGQQSYTVATLEYSTPGGLAWHAGWVLESQADTLRDTTGFRSDADVAGDENFRNFIDAGGRDHSTYSLGASDQLEGKRFGADAGWTIDYERHQLDWSWIDHGRAVDQTLGDNLVQALGRLAWKSELTRVTVGAGAVSTITGEHMPLGSVDWERKLPAVDGLKLFGGSAWRSEYMASADQGSLQSGLQSGAVAKLGAGYQGNGVNVSAHGFGRYYLDPQLPAPKAFWHYRELNTPDMAWVTGASATLEYRTLHHFSLQSNASSVYGEYAMQTGSNIAWPANARLELSSHLRVYPRQDSLISIILSHRAAWHRPLYTWQVQLAKSDPLGNLVPGTRYVQDSPEFTDLYRTDLRVNLDLNSAWRPLEDVRFYVELDNVFSPLGISWLQWLGADNARERSVVTQDADRNPDNGIQLVPFMAKGMGLYVQFGVEGSFGI